MGTCGRGYDDWLDRPLEDNARWEVRCERAEEEILAMPLSQLLDLIGDARARQTLLDEHLDDLTEARASEDNWEDA